MTHPKKAKRAGQVSTKGGTGKSTGSTNLGAFTADAGLRTLLIDLDPVQPSASSYYPLEYTAPGGIFELLSYNETDRDKIISRTSIKNLDVIISNDANNQLNNLILQAPDGRLRLANLMSAFDADYDLILFDTQGARSAMLEMVVLASDIILSVPDQANHFAFALLERNEAPHHRLWPLVIETCPLPLLSHWREPVIEVLTQHQMLIALPGAIGNVCAWRLAMKLEVLEPTLGELIRQGVLTTEAQAPA